MSKQSLISLTMTAVIIFITAVTVAACNTETLPSETIEPDNPEQSDPAVPDIPLQKDSVITLTFYNADDVWPFEEPVTAKSGQSETGEEYTCSGVTFKIGKGTASGAGYSFSKITNIDHKVLTFAASNGWITLPAVEGYCLKSVTLAHANANYAKGFRLQEDTSSAQENYYTSYDETAPGDNDPVEITVSFPTDDRKQGNLIRTESGTPYVMVFPNGKNIRIFSITLVYSEVLPAQPATAELLENVHMYAHRGAWSKTFSGDFIIPENSCAAIEEAARLGYEGIECDVKYTKDGKMVIMHDATINRTMRNAADYSELTEDIKVSDLTLDELRNNYVLASIEPSLRTPIPTLEEHLLNCKRCGIVPMLHSSLYESYELAQQIMGDDWICFTGKSFEENVVRVREELKSDCIILWSVSSGTPVELIEKLSVLGGKCGISSVKYSLYTPELISTLRDAGYHVQISIFPAKEELNAVANGADFLLTDRRRPSEK